LGGLGANVRVADPHVSMETEGHPLVEVTREEVSAADAVILITDHDAFDFDLISEHARYVLDTRNRVQGPQVEQL
jgi:UDP-N-acetyl-D-glucosamine dehydrogenase